MTIGIVNKHNLYDVTFFDDQIQTVVTHCPSTVESWLIETHRIHSKRLHHLIVGLDVEWRPNEINIENPVATLQLCVGHRCLIFQILHSPSIPPSLVNFLGNASYTFVGVGIACDVEKLLTDYGIGVANVVDLRKLAAEELGVMELRKAGLKRLAKEVLGMEVEEPTYLRLSRWDDQGLTPDQVGYACVDAFLSFEIGRSLDASGSGDVGFSGFWGGYLGFGLYFKFMLFIMACLLAIGCLGN